MTSVALYMRKSYDIEAPGVWKIIAPWCIVADFGDYKEVCECSCEYLVGGIAGILEREGRKSVSFCVPKSRNLNLSTVDTSENFEVYEKRPISPGKFRKISKGLEDLGFNVF